MKEDDRFIPFFEAYKDDFFESMEDVRMYLKNNNLEYQNIEQKCKMLSKIIILNYKLQEIEENEIYFKGGMDAYFYFRKLGILK